MLFLGLALLCGLLILSDFMHRGGTNGHILYFAMIMCPLYSAVVYSYRGQDYRGILKSGLFAGLAILIFAQGHGYMACLVFSLTGIVSITAAIIKNWFAVKKVRALVLVYLPTITVMLYALFGNQSYLSMRGRGIFFPSATDMDWESNYVPCVIRQFLLPVTKLIGEGGSFDINGGMAKTAVEQVLPMWWSDYSLAYVTYKFGLLFSVAIIAVLCFLMIKMFFVSCKQSSRAGFIICLSVTCILFINGALYILSNFGYMSAIAAPLPFIGYGKMSISINMFLMGLFLSVCRNRSLAGALEYEKSSEDSV